MPAGEAIAKYHEALARGTLLSGCPRPTLRPGRIFLGAPARGPIEAHLTIVFDRTGRRARHPRQDRPGHRQRRQTAPTATQRHHRHQRHQPDLPDPRSPAPKLKSWPTPPIRPATTGHEDESTEFQAELSGATKTVNRDLEAKARALAGPNGLHHQPDRRHCRVRHRRLPPAVAHREELPDVPNTICRPGRSTTTSVSTRSQPT